MTTRLCLLRSSAAILLTAIVPACCRTVHAAPGDFPEVFNTQEVTVPLTPAAEAARRMQVPDGFRVTVFASEPDVRQPIAITTDDRGRLWVCENYTYAESAIKFDARLRDRIVILEDSNHDGRADRRTVFWDGADKLTSVALGFGGVWALCAPHLLFIPDRDGDDVPDGPPVVKLDGWDAERVRHNIVNGLRWGPDGWLYGRHGILATSRVGTPGASSSQRVAINCGIWRYHPTRDVVEAVAHGTTNPWGFDYDDHGQMFFINTVIGHLFHVVPGAHYKRMYGVDLNPHVYELIDACSDHYHWDTGERWSDTRKIGVTPTTSAAGGGHAHCGMMIYLGDNWPERYRGGVFTVNLHGLRVNNDRLVRRASGYVGEHAPDFLKTDDPWFRGVELVYGADGGVYIADWSDVGECHENDGVHRTSGRIFKVTYGDPAPPPGESLNQLNTVELADLQTHRNDWFVRRARRLLQERAAAGEDLREATNALRSLFTQQTDVTRRLRALWALNSVGAADEPWLASLLSDDNEHVRVWALRLLVDGEVIPRWLPDRLTQLAADEPSAIVRLFIASAMQKLPLAARWPIAEALGARREDAADPMIPLMLWYGIEPAVPAAPLRAARFAVKCQLATTRRLVARRLTEEIEMSPAGVGELVKDLPRINSRALRLDLLRGMNAALKGWGRAPAPIGWDTTSDALVKAEDAEVRRLVGELSLVFGAGRGVEELRQLVANNEGEPTARRSALRILAQNAPPDFAPELQKRLGDRVLQLEAVSGLARFNHPATGGLLIERFESFDPDVQAAAVVTLVARHDSARAFLQAVDDGAIERSAITALAARQIVSFNDAQLTAQLTRLWGAIRKSPAEKRELIASYKQKLTPEELSGANLRSGRALYDRTCASCHVLFGAGRHVGPDLTGAGRQNLDYLLENIVDPSASVAADFQVSVLTLNDGRVLSGVVLRQDERAITVQVQTETLTFPRDSVVSSERTPQSLMPDGLLNALSGADVRDLVGYLMSPRQVEVR